MSSSSPSSDSELGKNDHHDTHDTKIASQSASNHQSDDHTSDIGRKEDKEPSQISKLWSKYGKSILYALWSIYVIVAIVLVCISDDPQYNGFKSCAALIGMTAVVFLHRAKSLWGDNFKAWWIPIWNNQASRFQDPKTRKMGTIGMAVLYIALLALFVSLSISKTKQLERLIGLSGMCAIVLILFGTSSSIRKIRWRPVIGGMIIQLCLGFFVLQTSPGYHSFNYLSDKFAVFLAYVTVGAAFIFGEDMVSIGAKYGDLTTVTLSDGLTEVSFFPLMSTPAAAPHYTLMYFGTVVVTTVMFFAAVVAFMYYIGAMQPFIKGLAFCYRKTLGTTMPESINSAGNMFLGQTEAPLLIKPFLKTMTDSEIHAVMVGGFATVAGAVMGSYMSMGVPAGHLLTSTAMSAPISLAFSKLKHPETEKPPSRDPQVVNEALYSGNAAFNNVIEAVCSAISDAIFLALNIAAMVFVFMSLIAFADDIVAWLFWMLTLSSNEPDGRITMKYCLGIVLSPLCFLLGVPWKDCRIIGTLIGTKIVLNEFVAFSMLQEYIANNAACAADASVCSALVTLDPRSVTIASYSLCGFGNLGSIGIQIGGLTPMAPNKRKVFTTVCWSAIITGCLCNMFNGALAGMLEDPSKTFY